jgi:triphosphoribosyl-dephospho-CoA synthase
MNRNLEREIAEAVQIACLLEVSASKPGNVNRFYNFRDIRYEDFLVSAVAMGDAFREVLKFSVGEIILNAIQATRRYITSNTNLGIVLLFAPIARAYAQTICLLSSELRASLKIVLDALTVEDTRNVYEAIRLARPGGMGKAAQHDVYEEPQVSLLEAMAAAAYRDSIAREYTSGFEITFNLGYPTLQKYLEETRDCEKSIVQTYLTILSEIPDTLIARKKGMDVSRNISMLAKDALQAGGILSMTGQQKLQDLDRFLRSEGNQLNPGTTADLTATALFVIILLNGNVL